MKLQQFCLWPLAAALLLAACSLGEDITPPPNTAPLIAAPGTVVTPSVGDGAAIFAQHCAPCHGVTGKGDGPLAPQLMSQRSAPLPDFSSPAWLQAHTSADLFQVISDGRLDKLMPPWKDKLTETERWSVVSFLGTLSLAGGANGLPNGPAATALATSVAAATAVAAAPTVAGGTSLPAATSVAAATPVAAITTTAAAGAQVGEVTGQVVNASQGAAYANQPVVLHGYDNFSLAATLTTTTAADGSFDFSGVPYVAGRQFMASAAHAGLDYSSDLINFDTQPLARGVRITVYDVTTDPSVLQVEQMHITIGPQVSGGQVDVAEMLLISNSSDKMFVPGAGPALAFPLPSGASALTLPSQRLGLDLMPTTQSVILGSPIQPGSSTANLSFSLRLPYSDRLDFEQKLAYPVKVLNVLVPATNATLQGAQLQDQGTQTAQNETLRVYAAQGLPANGVVSFKLAGLAGASGLGSLLSISSAPLGWALGVAALVLVAAGGGLRWRWWRTRPVGSVQTYDDLVQAIADLDDAFEAGRLPAQRYQHQRGRLKQKLLDWMKSHPPVEP